VPVLVPRPRIGLGLAERREEKGARKEGGGGHLIPRIGWKGGGGLRENDGKYDKVE
jgi:hypothetical protein